MLQAFFLPALADLGAGIIVQDKARNYLFVANLPDAWTFELKGEGEEAPSDGLIFGEELGGRLAQIKDTIRKAGDSTHLEVAAGSDRVYEFRMQAVEAEGRGLCLVTIILDRSEARHRERLLKALLREVSHRSKNLLAIIQSIALQTARHSDALEPFLHKFRGRLYSLSQSQDLITDSSWRGAYFFDLVHQQTDKYLPENHHLVRTHGDNVLLSPNASLHIGLALHELVVNAVSHGSLLRGAEAVDITTTRLRLNSQDWLEILWDEALDADNDGKEGGEERRGDHFGSTVLEHVVPASVSGRAQYAIGDGRISYRLVFPLEHAGD